MEVNALSEGLSLIRRYFDDVYIQSVFDLTFSDSNKKYFLNYPTLLVGRKLSSNSLSLFLDYNLYQHKMDIIHMSLAL